MTAPYVLVDLFSGTGSLSQPFVDHPLWDVYSFELDPQFDPTYTADILELTAEDIYLLCGGRPPTMVLAEPPCTSFSMASVRHHWLAYGPCAGCHAEVFRAGGETWQHIWPLDNCDNPRPVRVDGKAQLTYWPKSATAREGHTLLTHTLRLIHDLSPEFWAIENPRALMRQMPELKGIPQHTITHCQYGDPRRMKPTDLFGYLPPGFQARACVNGAPCHEAAPRGARTGTQGLSTLEAGMLPYGLGAELCAAATPTA